jgi:alcohol dehydrogenase
MSNIIFKKFLVTEESPGNFVRQIVESETDSLPGGDVLIKVHFSSLNFKDALSARGHKGITRKYPHTPGIDAAGIVIESNSALFIPGDNVIVTGYDLGMNTSGGFGAYIRVPSEWVVPLPQNLSLRESMILGTAGFTSGLCLYEFQRRGFEKSSVPVLVTGATGGVGTTAIAILSKLGFEITASTGKTGQEDFLKSIGASNVIPRISELDNSSKPLLERKWNCVIDNVGGDTLNYCIKTTDYWGTVAVVGMVASDKLNTTVYPFILRGVGLVGIDSADRPYALRKQIWNNLANDWKPINLEHLANEITIDQLSVEIDKILAGEQIGRVLLRHE